MSGEHPGADFAAWWLMARRLAHEMLGPEGGADPPWYILLDLYRAQAVGRKVQITSLPPMIGATHSTAGRWTRRLIDQGLLVRIDDPADRRRSYVDVSPDTSELMRRFFATLGAKGVPPSIEGGPRDGAS